MNRLIVLNRFFYPDYSATSQILTNLRLPSRRQEWTCIPQRKCVHSAQPRETRLAPPERLR